MKTAAERKALLQWYAAEAEAAENCGNNARLAQCVNDYLTLATRTDMRTSPAVIRSRTPACFLKVRTSSGRQAADGVKGLIRKQVMLDPDSIAKLRAAGGGELSRGIRAVAKTLP